MNSIKWPVFPLILLLLALTACSSKRPKTPPATYIAGQSSSARPPHCPAGSPYPAAEENVDTRGHYTAGGLYRPGVPDSTPADIPDVSCIPEPVVLDEPRSAIGNRSPYTVLGKQYQVLARADGYVERGLASYYGVKFHGRRTSNREVYDMYAFTAAHKNLPLPSFARVTNLDNGKSVVVRVNDRGPFHAGRVVDLSYAAAVRLDMVRQGTARVEVRALTPGSERRGSLFARQENLPAASPPQPSLPPAVAATAPSGMSQLIEKLPITEPSASAATASPMQELIANLPATPAAPLTTAEHPAIGGFMAQLSSLRPATAISPSVEIPSVSVSSHSSASNPPTAQAPSAQSLLLQVASFASHENALRVIGQLAKAGINAMISDLASEGRTLWQVQVIAADVQAAAELASRIAGLGFGQPQIVYD